MGKIFPKSFLRISSAIAVLLPLGLKAQVVGPTGTNTNGSTSNAIITGVPFLSIAPDSRSGAMGDAGVALSPDVNATYWNPSKLAFIEGNDDLSLSYSPWLRRLVPDVDLAYLSYAHRVDERSTIGASLRYFNLGSIQLVDANQNDQGTYRPSEFSLDVSYARAFGDNFSLGLTTRYIHSNLSNGAFTSGQQTKPANALAADVSMYYRKTMQQFGKDAQFAFGVDISNIGTKISYADGGVKYFLPTNLKIGAANTWSIDEYNDVTLTLDLNKLLVPTPPIRDNNGDIVSGKEDDRSVVSGIFGSFSDAPGGFSEEMREISYSPGVEYRYNKQFALRLGYFYEDPTKGDRQYLTMGAGFKYDIFNLDFSYLAANQQKSPLSNTIRFSVIVNFGTAKNTSR